MTHTTEQERAEFEANELESGRVVCINGIGGRYTDPIQQARWESWQAARRAQVVAVPQGWDAVAELCAQMCEIRASAMAKDWQLTAANEARKCASVLRNPPDAWREKLDAIAAAPQPPKPLTDAQILDAIRGAKKIPHDLAGWVLKQRIEFGRAIERAHGIAGGAA